VIANGYLRLDREEWIRTVEKRHLEMMCSLTAQNLEGMSDSLVLTTNVQDSFPRRIGPHPATAPSTTMLLTGSGSSRALKPIGLRLQEIRNFSISGSGPLSVRSQRGAPQAASVEIDAEIAGLEETKRDLLAFTRRFTAIDCPEGAEPWPCAEEFIAAATKRGR
jgi:hypothetical protein